MLWSTREMIVIDCIYWHLCLRISPGRCWQAGAWCSASGIAFVDAQPCFVAGDRGGDGNQQWWQWWNASIRNQWNQTVNDGSCYVNMLCQLLLSSFAPFFISSVVLSSPLLPLRLSEILSSRPLVCCRLRMCHPGLPDFVPTTSARTESVAPDLVCLPIPWTACQITCQNHPDISTMNINNHIYIYIIYIYIYICQNVCQ